MVEFGLYLDVDLRYPSGSIEISKLFHDKYRLLYSSVPTDTKELDDLHNDLNNGITPNDHVMITPAIIR